MTYVIFMLCAHMHTCRQGNFIWCRAKNYVDEGDVEGKRLLISFLSCSLAFPESSLVVPH